VPAFFNDYGEVILCKSWAQKKWKQTKKFVKKHKKAIIIGAAVILAATVVVVAVVAATSASAGAAIAGAAETATSSAGTALAGAAGAAASSSSDKLSSRGALPSIPSMSSNTSPVISNTHEAPTLKAALDEQIFSFKENIVKEQFFSNTQYNGLSWEENGRALGSLFAHDSLKNLNNQIPYHPRLAQEVQDMSSKYFPTVSKEICENPFNLGHLEIDRKFSTDYASLYSASNNQATFNTYSHQVRGERALDKGHYEQAIQDLGKAIELNPASPIPYLERSIAHLKLGQYDSLLEDYNHFTNQAPKNDSPSFQDFSKGFAKGLPNGIYESGRDIIVFLTNAFAHPVQTGGQMLDAITVLTDLARTGQWSSLSEILVPEIHQLIQNWNTIPSDKRGELAGHAFGKYGTDILIPGALAKAVSKGIKGTQELSNVYRGLKTAEQTLLLESVAGLESGARIAEVVQLEKQISGWLGEGARFIRNNAEDPVFLSRDGLRKVRFDFNRPNPHESPHLHLENLVDGEWQEISREYPIDVPHK
jgi:tetratricopeptide (TPR) repeat protein